jgi:hypothetical protein
MSQLKNVGWYKLPNLSTRLDDMSSCLQSGFVNHDNSRAIMYALKILINSGYGVFGSEHFRFSNLLSSDEMQ